MAAKKTVRVAARPAKTKTPAKPAKPVKPEPKTAPKAAPKTAARPAPQPAPAVSKAKTAPAAATARYEDHTVSDDVLDFPKKSPRPQKNKLISNVIMPIALICIALVICYYLFTRMILV